MAIQGHEFDITGGLKLWLYGETVNLEYFLNGPIEVSSFAGPSVQQVSRSGGTRRRYPGGPAISFPSSTPEVLRDPSRRRGGGLPGFSFTVRELDADKFEEGLEVQSGEVRVFTAKGRMLDLHAFWRQRAKRPVRLYGPRTANFLIPPAGFTP